jgi:hypothetical protein
MLKVQKKIIITGYEEQRVMVMLRITAGGHKLYIILKGKTIPKNDIFPEHVIVRAQRKRKDG